MVSLIAALFSWYSYIKRIDNWATLRKLSQYIDGAYIPVMANIGYDDTKNDITSIHEE